MNIVVARYVLMNQLLNTTDENVIKELVSIFKKLGNKSQNGTVTKYNDKLEAAESSINKGKFISHNQLQKEIKGW